MKIKYNEKIWDSFGKELCDIMKSSTVDGFIDYLKDKANETLHTTLSVDDKLFDVILYFIEDASAHISDIFIVTSDGRLYCQKFVCEKLEFVNNSIDDLC